jgi:hypothetical protein
VDKGAFRHTFEPLNPFAMRSFLLLFCSFLLSLNLLCQTPQVSKIILKNNDVLTGQIIEMKAGEYVKIEIVGKNVLTIPYSDIAQILLDANQAPTPPSTPAAPDRKPTQSAKPLRRFYFETINEASIGLGMGKVYGFNTGFENVQLANRDVYGGFYTTNGVGYNNMLFAGIGIGILGHGGYSDDNNDFGYSLPFTLDLRYRPLPTKQFSPLVMLGTGMSYYEGSIGTFTMLSGLGLSIRFRERFDAQLLLTHHYDRFSPQLSVENGILEDAFNGVYVNYGGARIGISYRM